MIRSTYKDGNLADLDNELVPVTFRGSRRIYRGCQFSHEASCSRHSRRVECSQKSPAATAEQLTRAARNIPPTLGRARGANHFPLRKTKETLPSNSVEVTGGSDALSASPWVTNCSLPDSSAAETTR